MGKKYLNKVNRLVRRVVTQLLLEHSNDPRFEAVTITDVSVNRDTTRAEVFYSVYGAEDEMPAVQAALDGAAGWLRGQMAPALRLRNIPQLVFRYDPSLVHGARIDEILNQYHSEEQQADDPDDDTLGDGGPDRSPAA